MWWRNNKVKIFLVLLLISISTLFVYIYFSFLPTIIADSVGYYSYMDILRRERDISAWNYLRGPTFPVILYVIFAVFGDNPIGFLFGTLFFWILCIFFVLRIYKLSAVVDSDSSCIFVSASTVLFIVFNPLIIGYFHAMMTEFVACTFTVIAIYFSFKWIEISTKKIFLALYYLIFFCILGVVMWFLKQPYLFCVIIPMVLSLLLWLFQRKDILTLFYKILSITLVILSSWFVANAWNKFLINNGAVSSVQSQNYISAVAKSGLTSFSVASSEKQTLGYIEENKTMFSDDELLELNEILNGSSKYNQYEIVELNEEGSITDSFLVFWNNSGDILKSESISYYFTILKKFPLKVLQEYIDNYLTIANVYGCGNRNWTGYYPIKELKNWSCENKSIGLSAYETDLIPYDSNSTDWKSGNNDMSQYELINSPVTWVQKLMVTLSEPALLLFKILLVLSPFIFVYSYLCCFFYKDAEEYRGFYKILTLLFGYSFLYVLMNAVTGSLIDRYAFVPFFISTIGLIVLLELWRRKVFPKITNFWRKSIYRIKKLLFHNRKA